MLTLTILQFLSRYAEDVLDKGFSWGYIMKLVFHSSATLIGISLTFGIVITSVFTFKLFSKNKLVDFKREFASGLSIMAAIALLLFVFSNWVVPKSKLEMYATLYEMRVTAPGEEADPVDRNLFSDNHAMLTIKSINLKADTLENEINDYQNKCDSILRLLPDSIAFEQYDKLGLNEFGIEYINTASQKLTGRDAKRATLRLQSYLRNLKNTVSKKQKFTKEISSRIGLPIILVLLYIIGASFGYIYNDQKSFLLVVLALYTTTFFFNNELQIVNSIFIKESDTTYSIIVLVVVTSIFFIKALRKKQEITQPNTRS
jgi:Predicted permeases